MRFIWAAVTAIVIRIVLFALPFSSLLADRIEVASPISSYKRLNEALFLIDHGLSPYDGDVYHQVPLLLQLATIGYHTPYARIIHFVIMILADILTALSLWSIVKRSDSITRHSDAVASCYLLNPFTIVSCVGLSTVGFVHCSIAVAIALASYGSILISPILLAIAAYLDVYPLLLLPPLILVCQRARYPPVAATSPIMCRVLLPMVVTFTGTLAALFMSSYALHGDWTWIEKSYGIAFSMSDLTPNIGLLWYFFTEMFDRFRVFFLVVCHTHLLFYLPPLLIRFRDEPLFVCWCMVAISSIFKAYPVVGDAGFSLSFLFVHRPLLEPKMRRIYPLVFLFALSSTLAVLMWFLWIFPGSGNANFLYFQTLIFIFCNAFVLIESIGAVRRLKASLLLPPSADATATRVANSFIS